MNDELNDLFEQDDWDGDGWGLWDAKPLSNAPTLHEILGEGGLLARTMPGYEFRPGQLGMAQRVGASIAECQHTVVEAPTGIGKSLGYLLPIVCSGKRAVISTGNKALQQQLIEKDIPQIRALPGMPEFTAAVLKGRSNYLCQERLADIDGRLKLGTYQISSGNLPVWEAVKEWSAETETGDMEEFVGNLPPAFHGELTVSREECLGQRCKYFKSCFAERARARSQHTDITIVNHALLLTDLRYNGGSGSSQTAVSPVVVIDEAHDLANWARSAYGETVSLARWHKFLSRLDRLTVRYEDSGSPEFHREISPNDAIASKEEGEQILRWAQGISEEIVRVFTQYESQLEATGKNSVRFQREEPKILALLTNLNRLNVMMLQDLGYLDLAGRESWRRLRKQLETFIVTLEKIAKQESDHDYARYMTREQRHLVFYLRPISVSALLKRDLWDLVPVAIATSATLTVNGSFDYWRHEVGQDDGTSLQLPSPFPYQRNARLYLPARGYDFDPTKARGDDQSIYYDRLATEMLELTQHSPGGSFLLFSSFNAMRAVHGRIGNRYVDRLVVMQGTQMSRTEMLRRFRDDGRAVLFGTRSFWEGVDIAGEALSTVVIDKIPFSPPDDPVFAARCEQAGRGWFMDISVPEAALALKQGVGRLLRRSDDRGVFAILDGRVTTAAYGRVILNTMPPAPVVRTLEEVRLFHLRQEPALPESGWGRR